MDGMSVETLELLQETAVKASDAAGKLAIVAAPHDPTIYFTVDPQGKIEKRDVPPKPRNHRLNHLEEIGRFVTEKGGPSTVVWYDRSAVLIVVDDATRRDTAVLELKPTPQTLLLQRLEKDRPGFDQRAFRRLLRIDLADCQRDARLFNWVSDLKFANMSGAVGQFSAARESLGTDIEAQAVSGAGECPEELVLDVRIFDDPSLIERHPIRCAFEFTPQEREFRLIPFPTAIHDAIELEVAYIGEKLRGMIDCSCFRGRFNG